ncbi:MAG: DUF1272 domain-containing protein [Xanthomonadales bacterium]|nr:DUF1272 domain-containing protein [Xanthomonadales bacterium]
MLEMKPHCERCDHSLKPESQEAFICSYECTFCKECAEQELRCVCPNCGGELVKRPSRKLNSD